jgi:hypothetical protein
MSIDLSDIIYLLFRKFLIWNPWKSIIRAIKKARRDNPGQPNQKVPDEP